MRGGAQRLCASPAWSTGTSRFLSRLQFDVVPKPDPMSHMGVGGPRGFVRPGRTLARVRTVREIEELHTVGTAMIGRGLGGGLQKFHAHRLGRKVVIPIELGRAIALRDYLTLPLGFHDAVLPRCPARRNRRRSFH